jgi:glycosyltransferase involved in cell wall biosynthesis
MRALHIYKGDLYGGIEAMLSTLARTQDLCRDIEHHFGLCSRGRLYTQLTAEAVALHYLGPARGRDPISVWRSRRRLTDILRSDNIDVAICHGTWTQALFGPAVQRAGVAQVFWQHDLIRRKGWIETLAAQTQPQLAISNSDYSRSTLAGLYPDVPSCVLHCPVELYDQKTFGAQRETVRKQLNTPSDRTVIIQVSRLHSGKGHEVHIQALGRLRGLPNWECWMVGGPQHRDETTYFKRLQASCRELGIQDRVRFLGERNDVPELMAAAEIYCQPNTEPEAFGLTFIEALVMGLPVVTSRIGAASEIVDDSCGVLLEAGDPLCLSETLAHLVRNKQARSSLSKAGAARAEALCAPERQLQLLADTLAKLCYQAVAAGIGF